MEPFRLKILAEQNPEMIYRIKHELYRFQSILTSPVNDEAKWRKIAEHWKGLERNSVWYHRTGLGTPENEDTIKKRFKSLFETFPSEMSLAIPPSKPPDITMVLGQTVIAFSTNIESRCPRLLVKLKEEGVIIDYPYAFSLKKITDWLESDKTLRKWPRLKRVSCFPVEIKNFGARYTVYNPDLLKDYRIRLFCCTNWQHDLVDTGRTKGQWNSWGVDEKSRVKYFRFFTGFSGPVFGRITRRWRLGVGHGTKFGGALRDVVGARRVVGGCGSES